MGITNSKRKRSILVGIEGIQRFRRVSLNAEAVTLLTLHEEDPALEGF